MSRCHDKRHSVDSRDEDGKKITGFAYSCIPHGIYGKTFKSKAGRERFIEEHHKETDHG